jgi:monoamine oxidase
MAASRRVRSADGQGSGDDDVLILGAGMAGLHAARLLQAEGLAVRVLEGSTRIGGRVWTAYHVPGQPELGASQLGASYGRVLGNARELGVEVIGPKATDMNETRLPPISFSIGGAAPTADWAGSAMNRLAPAERALKPPQLFMHYLLKDDPLADPSDWLQPRFAGLDRLSLRQYLQQRGASAEALPLIEVSNQAWTLDAASALDTLRKNHFFVWSARQGSYVNVKGGTTVLTNAMAASLARPVETGKYVASIDAGADRVTVHCRDGSSYRARAAICTIPLSVLRDLEVNGPVPAEQRRGWARQMYAASVGVFMKPRSAFWEQDGLPPTTWTDGKVELFIHRPSREDPLGTIYGTINGAGVRWANELTPQALRAAVVAEYERLRPAARGQLEPGYIHNWATYPYTKGHIAYFRPGDMTRFGDLIGRPVGSLYFAGEHLARIQAGIEGACETAESAALAILERFGRG